MTQNEVLLQKIEALLDSANKKAFGDKGRHNLSTGNALTNTGEIYDTLIVERDLADFTCTEPDGYSTGGAWPADLKAGIYQGKFLSASCSAGYAFLYKA